MNIVTRRYKKAFLHRYDKDGIIPYLSHLDFSSLKFEKNFFLNLRGERIAYYFYYYDNYDKNTIILFCPGIGPGHSAYMREIEKLCKHGYKVLTLDYSGTGESDGDSLLSFNAPTRDIDELLSYLKLKEKIIIIGHSLGAYSALNIANIRKDIFKAVIISGFLSIELEFKELFNNRFLLSLITKYERKLIPQYGNIDNIAYLGNTDNHLLFIHSKDDPKVPYKYSTQIVEGYHNPNIKIFTVNDKHHNPTYTVDAVKYMEDAFLKYAKYCQTHKDYDSRKQFINQFSALKMTEQDDKIWTVIFDFIAS